MQRQIWRAGNMLDWMLRCSWCVWQSINCAEHLSNGTKANFKNPNAVIHLGLCSRELLFGHVEAQSGQCLSASWPSNWALHPMTHKIIKKGGTHPGLSTLNFMLTQLFCLSQVNSECLLLHKGHALSHSTSIQWNDRAECQSPHLWENHREWLMYYKTS